MPDYLVVLSVRYGSWLAFLSGLALPLAFAPFAFAPVAILSLAVLLLLWQDATPVTAARRGFAWGFGAFLAGLYWLYISLHIFGKAPLWLSVPLMLGVVAIMALYPALAGYLYARFAPASVRLALLLFLPAIWALLEWLRGWLASGFPWLAMGYSQTDTVLAGFAPIGGVYLVGALVAASAGALVCLIIERRRGLVLTCLLSLWVIGAAIRPMPFTVPKSETLTVSLLQGAVPQDQKWLPEQFAPTLDLYLRMTRDNWTSDLVIWPEAAIPALLANVEDYLGAVWQAARANDTALLIGIPRKDPDNGQYFNSVVALDEVRTIYDKRHLVPFGEYFPVPDFVRRWMRLMNLPYSDFTAGRDDQAPVQVAGETLAVTICYEDVFGAEQLREIAHASLLVNVSNDAWFGDSIAPHQHLQIARMRAMETRRPMLRATNTGISAFIGPGGEILRRSQQFSSQVLTAEVRGHKGKTPYMVLRDWLLVVLAATAVAVALLADRRRPV